MSELVDHLAELTGYRDRDVLDVTLAGALRNILSPIEVAIYRSVGAPGQERWLTRARQGPADTVATADSAWSDFDLLPRIADIDGRRECLATGMPVERAGPTHKTFFPLTTDRETVGVLELETQRPLDADQQRIIGSVLRVYQNFHSVLDYSERDTLTGLLNRKTFDETFLKATAPRAAKPLATDRRSSAASLGYWLAVIDIDHFKRVNDTFGHLIGDEVLLLLARLMRSTFRHHDRLYRFGGEEFVVLMRCASDADARGALERLRVNVERYAFPQVRRITVSAGFTGVRANDTPSAAFERADKAVYHAKDAGRNRITCHADLVAGGLAEDRQDKGGDVELF